MVDKKTENYYFYKNVIKNGQTFEFYQNNYVYLHLRNEDLYDKMASLNSMSFNQINSVLKSLVIFRIIVSVEEAKPLLKNNSEVLHVIRKKYHVPVFKYKSSNKNEVIFGIINDTVQKTYYKDAIIKMIKQIPGNANKYNVYTMRLLIPVYVASILNAKLHIIQDKKPFYFKYLIFDQIQFPGSNETLLYIQGRYKSLKKALDIISCIYEEMTKVKNIKTFFYTLSDDFLLNLERCDTKFSKQLNVFL